MRHGKHRHQLGVKKEHRVAIMASLASALFRHDRIQTTLGYAKALRPFAEKVITLAKHAAATDDTAKKLHLRRLALAKIRDVSAVHFLFTEKVNKFINRNGGYIRIYKLVKRTGDAADMAIVELIEADDEGFKKTAAKKTAKKSTPKTGDAAAPEAVAQETESKADEASEAPKAAKKTATKKAAAKKSTSKAAPKGAPKKSESGDK